MTHWRRSLATLCAAIAAASSLGAAEPDARIEVLETLAMSMPDAAADATADRAVRGQLPMRRLEPGIRERFGAGTALWLKLRLRVTANSPEPWLIEFPLPVLDAVAVYQQDAAGQWRQQAAGDTIPVAQWPLPGRYPRFLLQLREGGPTEIYVHVRHSTPLVLPLRIVTSASHQNRALLEYLGLGMALGALALLVAWSIVRAWTLRDVVYGWYAGFALLSTLALAAFTGVAGHLLWGGSGSWVDAAPGCLALLAGGVAVLIVGHLSSVATRTRRLGRAVLALGASGLPFAALYLLLERHHGIIVLGLYLLFVSVLSLMAAAHAWRRGDPVGRWMLLGAFPLALSVLVALARVFNWIEPSWATEYSPVIALTVNLPTLLGALNSRSHERRGATLRQLAADSQDPLTGLLKAKPFYARLQQALRRFHGSGEGAAVAVITLANYDWLKSTRGQEAAEESLLRAVIKIRKLVRDVDSTGRIGEARFGLILEGVASRDVVTQVASRLIAAGLMEEPGRPDDAVLQFRIVAALLNDYAPPAEELMLALQRTLSGMHPRTRKPFRLLDPNDMRSDSSRGLDSGVQPLEPGSGTENDNGPKTRPVSQE